MALNSTTSERQPQDPPHGSASELALNQMVERAVSDLSAGYGGVLITIGHKLGLYKAMANAGPLTAEEVATRANCAPRYVLEWLCAQVAGRYIEYDPMTECFQLSEAGCLVLADDTSPVFMPIGWEIVASLWLDEAQTANAIRTGDGVHWGDHHERMFCGVAGFYRNGYSAALVQDWLPCLPGVSAKLERGARVADIGCGHGHATLIMAHAYPNTHFVGFDSHKASIDTANQLAEDQGLTDRVSFQVASANSEHTDAFDLICFFDCLHDMGDPESAISQAARMLAKDGSIMLVEPFANDQLENNINPVGRLYYCASTAICCAHALAEQGPYSLGAQAGEARLNRLFERCGFRSFERVTQTPFNLVFEAKW